MKGALQKLRRLSDDLGLDSKNEKIHEDKHLIAECYILKFLYGI
jgi:hypothetical protein